VQIAISLPRLGVRRMLAVNLRSSQCLSVADFEVDLVACEGRENGKGLQWRCVKRERCAVPFQEARNIPVICGCWPDRL
jgi:hypothetical protein